MSEHTQGPKLMRYEDERVGWPMVRRDVADAMRDELLAESAKTNLMLDTLATEWADKLDTMEDARDAALALLEQTEAEVAWLRLDGDEYLLTLGSISQWIQRLPKELDSVIKDAQALARHEEES